MENAIKIDRAKVLALWNDNYNAYKNLKEDSGEWYYRHGVMDVCKYLNIHELNEEVENESKG